MYRMISARFGHDFQRMLNEAEREGYTLKHYTHDRYDHFGVLWKENA